MYYKCSPRWGLDLINFWLTSIKAYNSVRPHNFTISEYSFSIISIYGAYRLSFILLKSGIGTRPVSLFYYLGDWNGVQNFIHCTYNYEHRNVPPINNKIVDIKEKIGLAEYKILWEKKYIWRQNISYWRK